MEGYLKKWVNIIYRWKTRYFILHDNILIYCEDKGKKKMASIYLKISSIICVTEDPLRIIINSGTKEIHMRASTIDEKMRWIKALKSAQEEGNKPKIEEYDRVNSLNENMRFYFNKNNLNLVNDKLGQIWNNQAQLQEIISLIKIDENPQMFKKLKNIECLFTNLKVFKYYC